MTNRFETKGSLTRSQLCEMIHDLTLNDCPQFQVICEGKDQYQLSYIPVIMEDQPTPDMVA